MRFLSGRFLTVFFTLPLLGLCPLAAHAQANIRIVSVSYDQHGRPDEPVEFVVTVRNNTATAQFAEVDVTLVNIDTEAESTLVPVLTGTIAAGGQGTLRRSYVVPAGIYTVTFPLFDGDGARTDRVSGTFPLHIGMETESIRVFPETISLGVIPPGRTMHPTPIEISWSFYRFNRLRLDQPFAVRVYTDNASRYRGVPGALHRGSPAGLVSMDGRYAIPLKVWTINFGPDAQETGWDSKIAGPPPVEDDTFWLGPTLTSGAREVEAVAWVRIPDTVEMTANPSSWRRLIGQDPFDTRYISDTNPTGDFTLTSPFTIYLATEGGITAVEGAYAATLIVELWSP